jgi:hypothetical protein
VATRKEPRLEGAAHDLHSVLGDGWAIDLAVDMFPSRQFVDMARVEGAGETSW